ncbi:MarR family winged helix-turn-helix transcriptional regulator [Oceanobacillus rekensis]|uniref:MarR family winged helix-turn-helix transcriptional regulator n=1 Tax=Oceanobacillus rekensis TaxID=937927 RepID=UPI000B44D9F1|nr:MarR family transcriptional regulator [Oceanobacillus rekensis]
MDHSFFHQQLQFTRSFKNKLNERLAEAGLFHSQWLLIYCLKQQKAATLVEISNYLNVEKPTITRTVKRLEEQMLIEKIPSRDKRERPIQLTEKGLHIYEEAIRIVNDFEQNLMEEISEIDQETTLRTIKRLKTNLMKEELR